MLLHKKQALGLLLACACMHRVVAHEPESFAMHVLKRSTAAAFGGGLFYILSSYFNGDAIKTHENKMKFLEDLKLYIESDEYIQQGESSRLFTHYYNGLNQLAQTTRGVEVSLLAEFSQSRSKESAQDVLHRVQELQAQLQATHEKSLLVSNVVMGLLGAALGAIVPFDSQDDKPCSKGCGHKHHHVYTLTSPRTPNSFFSAT